MRETVRAELTCINRVQQRVRRTYILLQNGPTDVSLYWSGLYHPHNSGKLKEMIAHWGAIVSQELCTAQHIITNKSAVLTHICSPLPSLLPVTPQTPTLAVKPLLFTPPLPSFTLWNLHSAHCYPQSSLTILPLTHGDEFQQMPLSLCSVYCWPISYPFPWPLQPALHWRLIYKDYAHWHPCIRLARPTVSTGKQSKGRSQRESR